jgi:hypothetical protein
MTIKPSGIPPREWVLDQHGWLVVALAGIGVVLFLSGVVGLLYRGDPRLFGPFFAAGLFLLFLSIVVALKNEPILTQALVYVGVFLLICITTFSVHLSGRGDAAGRLAAGEVVLLQDRANGWSPVHSQSTR